MHELDFNQHLEQSEKLFEQGHIKESVQNLVNLASEYPNNPHVLNNLGVVCYTLGQLKDAYEYLKLAINLDPDYQQAQENLEAVKSSLQTSRETKDESALASDTFSKSNNKLHSAHSEKHVKKNNSTKITNTTNECLTDYIYHNDFSNQQNMLLRFSDEALCSCAPGKQFKECCKQDETKEKYKEENIQHAKTKISLGKLFPEKALYRPGSILWLIRKEKQFGGVHTRVPRNKVSELDPRPPEQYSAGYLVKEGQILPTHIGGDRMSPKYHGYSLAYSAFIRKFIDLSIVEEKDLVLVEVGILKGTGLAIWCDLFPKATIIGLDIDTDVYKNNINYLVSCGAFKENKPYVYEFDQFKINTAKIKEVLKDKKIGIVIDDGAHTFDATINTFKSFEPFLIENFLYFIEDFPQSAKYFSSYFSTHRVINQGLMTVICPDSSHWPTILPSFKEYAQNIYTLQNKHNYLPDLEYPTSHEETFTRNSLFGYKNSTSYNICQTSKKINLKNLNHDKHNLSSNQSSNLITEYKKTVNVFKQASNYAILMISIGHRPWSKLTSLTVKNYASNIGADFYFITSPPSEAELNLSNLTEPIGRVNKQIYASKLYYPWYYLSLGYEKIMLIDDSCSIAPYSPNIFNVVPNGYNGYVCLLQQEAWMSLAGIWSWLSHSNEAIHRSIHAVENFAWLSYNQNSFNKINIKVDNKTICFDSNYYANTGVMLYDKESLNALHPKNIESASDLMYSNRSDQTLLFYLACLYELKMYNFTDAFNWPPGFNLPFNQRCTIQNYQDVIRNDKFIYHVTKAYKWRDKLIRQIANHFINMHNSVVFC